MLLSFLKVVAFMLNTQFQSFDPTFSDGVSEFPVGNLTDFEVDVLLQFLHIVEGVSPHVLLHSVEQEEVRQG